MHPLSFSHQAFSSIWAKGLAHLPNAVWALAVGRGPQKHQTHSNNDLLSGKE